VLKLLFSVQRLHGFGQVVQHALEASLIAGQLTDFARDQYLFYLRTCQTRWQMARVWESVVTYYTRMRITNDGQEGVCGYRAKAKGGHKETGDTPPEQDTARFCG